MKLPYKSARRILTISLCVLQIFLWTSCLEDEPIGSLLPNDKEITFSVKVPGSSTPKTYALNPEEENSIRTIEVLLFDTNGNYVYQPIYSNVINTDPDNSNIKTFTIKVPEGTYNMVILANARQSLNNALSSINTGDNKASVLEKLTLSNNGKWNTDDASGGYISIPMFGEIPSIIVNSSTPISNPVNLVRMISKIDVALTGTGATDNFKLESIRLYNYNNRGYIVPTQINWNQAQSIVTNASIPSLSTLTLGPLVYDGASITTPDISSIGEIYTFEAIKANPASFGNATCLVIGGRYISDSQTTYYRVDFAQTSSGNTTYLSLLRNHHYKINIIDVSGSGLPTATDAFNSRPVNIRADVLEWNDSEMSNVVFDGQYMLGVSQAEFSLPRNEHTASSEGNSLSITTDYPSGWSVDKIVDADGGNISWLSLVSITNTPVSSGPSGSTTNVKLKLTENTSGLARIGYIHLKAGRMVYVIKVTQSINAAISLYIKNATGVSDITELTFYSAIGVQPSAQQFKLKWTPTSASVAAVGSVVGSVGFSFGGSSDQPGIGAQASISDLSGEKLLTIQPTAIISSELTTNPFLVKVSKIDFSVSNGQTSLTQSLFLRHSVYNLVFSNVISSYWTNGSIYTFNVRSNASWRIKSVSQNLTRGSGSLINLQLSDNLKVGTTGGYNTDPGTPITFRVASNILELAGQITVVFESVDSPQKFSDVELVLFLSNEYYPTAHKGWAGSNIYWDGSKFTFDDVGVTTHKNYQGIYFKGGSLYGISPVGVSYVLTLPPLYTPQATITSGLLWINIPYSTSTTVSSNPPSGKDYTDRAYYYEITNEANGIGDICKYLTDKGWAPSGKKWRMPTSREFYAASSYTIVSTFGSTTSNQDNGSFLLNMGYNKTDLGTPFFPAAGYRDLGTGALVNVGSNGGYWSSSANGGNGYYMIFASGSNIYLDSSISRNIAFSVRCVVE